jgi:hypothetical protein
MPEISLTAGDALSLACFLWFLDEWVNASQDQLGESLTEFMSALPYDVGMLRNELTRYRAMLGGSTCIEPEFLRHPGTRADTCALSGIWPVSEGRGVSGSAGVADRWHEQGGQRAGADDRGAGDHRPCC